MNFEPLRHYPLTFTSPTTSFPSTPYSHLFFISNYTPSLFLQFSYQTALVLPSFHLIIRNLLQILVQGQTQKVLNFVKGIRLLSSLFEFSLFSPGPKHSILHQPWCAGLFTSWDPHQRCPSGGDVVLRHRREKDPLETAHQVPYRRHPPSRPRLCLFSQLRLLLCSIFKVFPCFGLDKMSLIPLELSALPIFSLQPRQNKTSPNPSIQIQVLGNLYLSEFTSWLYPLIPEKYAVADGCIFRNFTNSYPSREY